LQNASHKTNEEKLRNFNAICAKIKPVFHKFFEVNFPQPTVWYERRRAYIHSVATSSMCGYILGIGDRHLNNVLIDKSTAEVVHIDFGKCRKNALRCEIYEVSDRKKNTYTYGQLIGPKMLKIN
jgi:phosphatidylinositol kinase/protein kinase (PI-3  family)